jgi:hypothetical protein
MTDQVTMRINIARYRCLLSGALDAHMRRMLSEILSEEEARLARSAAEARRWALSSAEPLS